MSEENKSNNSNTNMKYRFVTKRDNDLEVIIVRNVLMPKKIHVVNDDIKFTINPFKRTAKLFVGDVKNDLKVDKVEIEGDSNIQIDLDITYKVSGEAYFEDYWAKKRAKEAENVSNKDLVDKLDVIKAKIVASENGTLSRRDLIKTKEVLNILQNRVASDDFKNRIAVVKNLVANKISDDSALLDLNDIDDIINEAKILFIQPVNSNNQDEHRKAIKELGFFKRIKEEHDWKYGHGAARYYSMAEQNFSDIKKFSESEIKTYIKSMCARMDYDEVKSIKHVDQSVVNEINDKISKYGIEVTAIRVQHVDQSNPELDAAGDKVKVAQKEREAILIKAQGEAQAIRAKGEAEADVERQKQEAIADGVKAKATALEGSSLDSSTKTALAGGNVSTFNLSGLGDVLGGVASRMAQPLSAQNNIFREVNAAGDWEDATVVDKTVDVNAEGTTNENTESKTAADEAKELSEEEKLIVRLEALKRMQIRTMKYMDSIDDKTSKDYMDAESDLADFKKEEEIIKEYQKKFQK